MGKLLSSRISYHRWLGFVWTYLLSVFLPGARVHVGLPGTRRSLKYITEILTTCQWVILPFTPSTYDGQGEQYHEVHVCIGVVSSVPKRGGGGSWIRTLTPTPRKDLFIMSSVGPEVKTPPPFFFCLLPFCCTLPCPPPPTPTQALPWGGSRIFISGRGRKRWCARMHITSAKREVPWSKAQLKAQEAPGY